jgi:Icc-related predicted phosphoesterase
VEIPENVDILISHDPPTLGDVGRINQINSWNFGMQCGNSILSEILLEKKPKNAFFGHIHSGCHEFNNIQGINMANVSILNENYFEVYEPLTISI